MAKEPGQEKSLHQLRQEVAHSRDRLARDLSGLRYELDFPLKFRKSFQRQTVVWITAAVVAVAFQPLRHRAGRLANRVVYGRRATPYEVLSDFSRRVGGAYSSEDVLPQMLEINSRIPHSKSECIRRRDGKIR